MLLNPDQDRAFRLLNGPQRHTCFVGGARSGKTTILVMSILMRALNAPGSRHGIFRQHANAAKMSIALDTLPKVAWMVFDGLVLEEHKQDGYFGLPNKSEVWVGGLDDDKRVDKILGREFATLFFNECSQIPYSTILTARTRLAQVVQCTNGQPLRPRSWYDLNPTGKKHWTNVLFGDKRDPVTREPLKNPDDYVRAFIHTRSNVKNLPSDFIEGLESGPERYRKRFLEGVYVDEVEDALWTYAAIEQGRRSLDDIPESRRSRVVVAVDPSGVASKDDESRDEVGIVVVALGVDGHAYVLADRSLRDTPEAWARVVATAYHEFSADTIVAETNFGGEMVRATIRGADPQLPVRVITASRGKAVRAEPVSVLYGRHVPGGEDGAEYKDIRVHHVERFPHLEDQLVAFTGAGYRGEGSPDRADSLVWAITELMLISSAEAWIGFFNKVAEQQRAAEKVEKPARSVPEKAVEAEGVVADAYRRVVDRVTGTEVLCDWCGEEITGDKRVLSGPDKFHNGCYQASLAAVSRRVDAL